MKSSAAYKKWPEKFTTQRIVVPRQMKVIFVIKNLSNKRGR